VLGPVSAASENSVHSRSRVQKAKGIDHASCKHRTLTPACPAASSMRATLSKIACAQLPLVSTTLGLALQRRNAANHLASQRPFCKHISTVPMLLICPTCFYVELTLCQIYAQHGDSGMSSPAAAPRTALSSLPRCCAV